MVCAPPPKRSNSSQRNALPCGSCTVTSAHFSLCLPVTPPPKENLMTDFRVVGPVQDATFAPVVKQVCIAASALRNQSRRAPVVPGMCSIAFDLAAQFVSCPALPTV
eukprot:3782510-Rhodomonas_salina.1